MRRVPVVPRKESCARAIRVEDREVRIGGFDKGAGKGLPGGGGGRIDFYREVGCREWGGGVSWEWEGLGGREVLLGVEGRGKCSNCVRGVRVEL